MTLGNYFRDQIRQSLNVVIEEIYPERQIIQPNGSGLLPMDTSLAPYKREFDYTVLRSQGIAEILATGSDDIPMVSHYADKKYGSIVDIALGYDFTDRELQLSMASGRSLENLNLEATRRGHDVKLEDIFYLGEAEHNLTGFLNFPGVTTETNLPDGVGNSTTFASKTPEQMYRDLTQMARRKAERTKLTFYNEIILLPTTIFNILNETLLNNQASAGVTVLEVFLKHQANNPFGVKAVIPVPYLEGRGIGGTGFGVGYCRKDSYITGILPEYFTVHPNAQPQNFKYSVNTRSTVGGTVVFHPLSVCYFDGL